LDVVRQLVAGGGQKTSFGKPAIAGRGLLYVTLETLFGLLGDMRLILQHVGNEHRRSRGGNLEKTSTYHWTGI
jgi:hypothetical protein